jgi:hypothetical protein
MAELAVTGGTRTAFSGGRQLSPSTTPPYGECIITSLPGGNIRITRADPRILIAGELLDAIARFGDISLAGDWLALNARLNTAGCMPPPWRATYVGAVVHINGVNQQVVYRITEYLPRINSYVGEWPD